MTATFFGLAVLAALNPKLLGLDLLMIQNSRPHLMFTGFLLGCMSVCISIGLLDVFVLHDDAIKAQGQASAALDLSIGVLLVVVGALIATGHPRRRNRNTAEETSGQSSKWNSWVQRLLSKPRFALAVLIGAVAGFPGATYVIALHMLVTGDSATATRAIAVVVFALVEFSLVIIPFAFLVVRPAGTTLRLQLAQRWFTTHARQILAIAALIVGAYGVISGVVQLI
jgi:hypothetical protein